MTNSRRKGHSFERATAISLREIWPEARRGLQYQDGAECPDVVGTPYWVECKTDKRTNIKAAVRQATDASKGSKPIIVVSKDDRQPILVTMMWETFHDLHKRRVQVSDEEGHRPEPVQEDISKREEDIRK